MKDRWKDLKIEYNDMLMNRTRLLNILQSKKVGWHSLFKKQTGKMMTLRGITKDIKKSGIMVLEKYELKDLDRILITNYKDTKFAEYTGKTKNEDERYTSNSEAMQFLTAEDQKDESQRPRSDARWQCSVKKGGKRLQRLGESEDRATKSFKDILHITLDDCKDPRFFDLTEKKF